ncbi:pLS20_p028 family conjugation system transmembrane protein [Enterococcus faecium]|nr:hypothetical protein [Enterococcus faecium]
MIAGIFSDVTDWWSGLFGGGDADPKAVTKILQDYSDYLQYQDIFSWICHTLVWGMIKGLYNLNRLLEKTIYQSFNLKDILNAAGLNELYQDLISKVLAILCVVTLIYLGIKFAVSKHPPKFKNIVVNLVLAMVLIFGGSSLIDEGLTISQNFYGDITAANKKDASSSPAFQIIQNNVWDTSTLLATDPSKIEKIPPEKRNGLTAKNFKLANINQVITPDQVKSMVKKTDDKTQKDRISSLQYRLDLDDTGKEIPVEISDEGLAKLAYTSGYRRYSSSSGLILSGEISLTAAYLFILFTIVTCIIELAFKKFYLVVAASTDFETGQRMKTAIEDIGSSFLLLAFTILELRIYTLMLSGIGDLHAANKLNGFLYVVALIVLTIALFKGSQSVTKIFGVDTSLKNSGNSLMSLFALGSIAKNAGSSAKSIADSGKSGLSKLNELRKNAFSKKGPDTDSVPSGDGETSAGNMPETGTLPKSDKKLSDVFGKTKDGLSKAAKGAGYTSERGLKQTVGDLKDKAKEAVGEKLDGTRAKGVANAIKNPSEVLEKAKDTANQVKTDLKNSYEEGELSAAVKGNQRELSPNQETGDTLEGKASEQDPKLKSVSPNSQKIPVSQLPKRKEDKGKGQIELPNKNGHEVGSLKSTKIDLPEKPIKNIDPSRLNETTNSFNQQAANVSLTPSRLPENGNTTTVSYAMKEPSIGSTKSLVSRHTALKPITKVTSGVRPASVPFEPINKITVSKETRAKNESIKNDLLKNIKR